MTRKVWSWLEIVALAKKKGTVSISWRWRNTQMRRAAVRAVRRGALIRAHGPKGYDYFVLPDTTKETGL